MSLNSDIEAAQGETEPSTPGASSRWKTFTGQVQKEESLAHITQAEGEAVKEFDAAVGRIEEFRQAEQKQPLNDATGQADHSPRWSRSSESSNRQTS